MRRMQLHTALAILVALGAGCSPSLHDVVARGERERAEQMLARDASLIETRSFDGKTPLHYAVVNARPDMVEWLLAEGADPNAADHTGLTPLHVAAALNRRPEARLLIVNGADLAARDVYGDTPLHSAALHGSARVLNDLLRAGADATAANDRGLNPGELAGEYGQASAQARLAMATGVRP
jgi:cytohesin